jgi:molybdenum cofactor biosynthesis protein B
MTGTMNRIDESLPFIPIRIAVLAMSDTRTAADDKSGDTLARMIGDAGHALAARTLVKDDIPAIRAKVESWIADPSIDVIITTGGTGFTGRDVTPEAVKPLFEKEIDGFSAVFHRISFETVGTSTIQSRACAGVARGTYIFCLPGSTGACKDAWNGILKWQLDNRHRPCNLVDIMPRLRESRDKPAGN